MTRQIDETVNNNGITNHAMGDITDVSVIDKRITAVRQFRDHQQGYMIRNNINNRQVKT